MTALYTSSISVTLDMDGNEALRKAIERMQQPKPQIIGLGRNGVGTLRLKKKIVVPRKPDQKRTVKFSNLCFVKKIPCKEEARGDPPEWMLKNHLHECDDVVVYENSEDETEEREYLKTLEDNLQKARDVNKNLNREVVDSYFEGRYCGI